MRTNEEMLAAVHDRATEMNRARRKRRTFFMGGGAGVLALVLIVLLASIMPSFQGRWAPDKSVTLQASVLADSGMLGYVVVGIVAFLLGIAVTVFCVLLHNRRDKEEQGCDRDH